MLRCAGGCVVAVAAPLVLREGDGARLRALTGAKSAPAGLVARARRVLLTLDGLSNAEIARRVGVSRQTASRGGSRMSRGAWTGSSIDPCPGPTAHGLSRHDPVRDAHAAAEEPGSDALVKPVAGPQTPARGHHADPHVAVVRDPAVAQPDIHLSHRPKAGRPRSPTWSACT